MTVDDLIARYRSPHSAPPILALAGMDQVDWSAVSDAKSSQSNAISRFCPNELADGKPANRRPGRRWQTVETAIARRSSVTGPQHSIGNRWPSLLPPKAWNPIPNG